MLILIFTTRFWKWMKFWWMNKKRRGYPVYLAVLILSAALNCFTSCKKDSGVGSDVLPQGDLLNAFVTDTTTVLSSIKLRDSVLSNSVAYYTLGSYNDPVFGMTKASFYTQVVLPGNGANYSFGSGFALDSVVLVLPFNTATSPLYPLYGSYSPQTFVVDTLDSAMVTSKSYYSDTTIAHGSKHVGMETITPALYTIDSINYGPYPGLEPSPELRIKLDSNFGAYIMNASSSYFQSAATFTTLLKGLYVSVYNPVQLPGQGQILYLNPYQPGVAGLVFYYKIAGVEQEPQVFQIGGGCAYFNHFDHDYSTTAFYEKGQDSVFSPNVAYLSALGGVKTKLTFPFLANWKKMGRIVINEAEVQIPVNVKATGMDEPPANAYLVRDSAGYSFSIKDESLGTYGGTYDATNQRYDFDIARYVQAVVDGKMTDRGLFLVAGSSAITANGAVLYGSAKNANSPRIRLKIYYTPINH